MNTRLIIEIAFSYLPDTTALKTRIADKEFCKYAQDNAVAIPYPTKTRFVMGISGLFNDAVSLEEAWQYYQAITTSNLTNPAVLYRLKDQEAATLINKRSAAEGNLRELFLVYKPRTRHFWNHNFIFMLAHMHYRQVGNEFTIISAIELQNFYRNKDPRKISAFGRELFVLLKANYSLNWDHVKIELILAPSTTKFTLPANGMKDFFVSEDQLFDCLNLFFYQKNQFMLSVIMTKITELDEKVKQKINELRTLDKNKNNFISATSLSLQECNPSENNRMVLDDAQQVLMENAERREEHSIPSNKRFRHTFDITYQLEHAIENFVEQVCADLFLFCCSPHINFKHVYFQIIKYVQFGGFSQQMTPLKLMNLSGSNDEKISTFVGAFQNYLYTFITDTLKQTKTKNDNNTLPIEHENQDDGNYLENKSRKGLI